MGLAWDASGVAFDPRTWLATLRVLRPGGHLLAFGAPRTYHRMTCAIEDAGFEVRDSIAWLFATGFPKSLDVGKAIDSGDGSVSLPTTEAARRWSGWGTGLKPAHEAIVVARKPLSEATVAANVLRHGTGAINVDAGRIPTQREEIRVPHSDPANRRGAVGAVLRLSRAGRERSERAQRESVERTRRLGRWPANVILSHAADCTSRRCEPGCPVAELDRQGGQSRSRAGRERAGAPGLGFALTRSGTEYDDAGGASRFFFVTKAGGRERNLGLDAFPERPVLWSSGEANPGSFQSANSRRAARNYHPTVKPVTLMRYLVRLVTSPGGTVLDPFAGSGSTGVAALLEGNEFIGVELDPGYVGLAHARLRHARATVRTVNGEAA